jgi:hypothetical protein
MTQRIFDLTKMNKLMFASVLEQMLKSLLYDLKTPYWAIPGYFDKNIPLKKAEFIDEDMIKHTFELTYRREYLERRNKDE